MREMQNTTQKYATPFLQYQIWVIQANATFTSGNCTSSNATG